MEDTSPGRPSVFQEGSMHDRVSDRPPPRFIGTTHDRNGDGDDAEAAMEEYIEECGEVTRRGVVTTLAMMTTKKPPPHLPSEEQNLEDDKSNQNRNQTPMPSQSQRQSQRRSGIFRLGKSLAAAVFNPAGARDDRTRRRKNERSSTSEIKHDDDNHRGSMDDRCTRAEQIYTVMKRDGRLPKTTASTVKLPPGVHGGGHHRHHHRSRELMLWPTVSDEPLDGPSGEHRGLKSDGSDVGSRLKSSDMTSPTPDPRSSQTSSFNFKKKRSVPNLKRVKSDIHRLTSESLTALGLPHPLHLVPSIPGDENSLQRPSEQRSIRPQASRKDLHRQQKLRKRVSDLEGKLEIARRELDEAKARQLQQPSSSSSSSQSRTPLSPIAPPNTLTLKAFVPGALPSLPSERLLFLGGMDDRRQALKKADERDTPRSQAKKSTMIEIRPEEEKARVRGIGDFFATTTPNTSPAKRKDTAGHDGDDEDDHDDNNNDDKHVMMGPASMGSVKRRRRNEENNSQSRTKKDDHQPTKRDDVMTSGMTATEDSFDMKELQTDKIGSRPNNNSSTEKYHPREGRICGRTRSDRHGRDDLYPHPPSSGTVTTGNNHPTTSTWVEDQHVGGKMTEVKEGDTSKIPVPVLGPGPDPGPGPIPTPTAMTLDGRLSSSSNIVPAAAAASSHRHHHHHNHHHHQQKHFFSKEMDEISGMMMKDHHQVGIRTEKMEEEEEEMNMTFLHVVEEEEEEEEAEEKKGMIDGEGKKGDEPEKKEVIITKGRSQEFEWPDDVF